MAAAEARTLWQRTANRCFVQEDAKRAPKLACRQSSCAASQLVDPGPVNTADASDGAAINATHFNIKSSFSHPSSDPRWWLHLQPNHGYKKGLTNEKLSALEEEVETLIASDESKFSCKNSLAFPELMDVMSKHEIMEIDSIACSVSSKQTNDFSMEPDYSWIESDKAEPWWRTTDIDELASFVSHKSLNHIENCDLPPPKKKHLTGYPCSRVITNDDKIKTASYNLEGKSGRFSNSKQGPSANEGLLYFASAKFSSHTPIHEDVKQSEQSSEGNTSKTQLMEALCHSQTRAREAEEAAKQAYAEKEHIIALIFKQASQLFAYKQLIKLLQLETLFNQITNNDQSTSTLFPVSLPWMSYEHRKSRKRKQTYSNSRRDREGKSNCDITTYAVAIALGLSLVGAGLLLGWTVGWMSPRS
ncbi:uncharacterized protein LOC123889553 [Trifolium pratense]|uniref:uncharacterized protein LOC123889553 n=1 Tax=Trifolium pratense TaxID=57577 RepID=UPI001E6980D7|nr:uncharacterized protein LOC123889553 [Trifolium pratense]XP_045794894.1 uncharacterized protein LOC123889553 [Trifolium pratense]XP_045794895.1 uncharacterized protein LOC123889553 [Trifolium pratense]